MLVIKGYSYKDIENKCGAWHIYPDNYSKMCMFKLPPLLLPTIYSKAKNCFCGRLKISLDQFVTKVY